MPYRLGQTRLSLLFFNHTTHKIYYLLVYTKHQKTNAGITLNFTTINHNFLIFHLIFTK